MKATEQGVKTDKQVRYSVIPRTLIFLTRREPEPQILLLKGAPTKRLWANKYNGIGGHVEWNETILAAAQRELTEETGLVNVALHLRGIVNIAVGTPPTEAPAGVAVYLFTGEVAGQSVQPGPEGLAEWLPIHAIQQYALVDDLYLLIPRLLESSEPVYARYYPGADGNMIYEFQDGGA